MSHAEKAQGGDRIFASPLAKQVAKEQNVDLSKVQGTGIEGSITKGDVEKFAASQAQKPKEVVKETPKPEVSAKPAAPAAATGTTAGPEPNQYSDVEVTNMRRVIASRLLESKQTIPHYYLTARIEMDAINK